MASGSKKAVITAIISNSIVTVLKFGAAAVAGSASMMNEAIHSMMDTANQGFLFRGLLESNKPADATYAFGHGQKKYLWNLWSAIGLFSIGSGLGLAHAWHAWHAGAPETVTQFTLLGFTLSGTEISITVLVSAILLEGFSFVVATRQFLQDMREEGFTNPLRYLGRSDDPTLVAVVLEDSVAMLGLAFACLGIGLTSLTGNYLWDIGFSVLIALMLGMIAAFLGWVNMKYLADVRDPKAEAIFIDVVREHPEVERYHDLRSIVLDDENTILVAEVELREESIISGLHESIVRRQQEILSLVPSNRLDKPEVQEYVRNRAALQATLERTEHIIEELVREVKQRLPRVTHATIEIEGIATRPEKDL